MDQNKEAAYLNEILNSCRKATYCIERFNKYNKQGKVFKSIMELEHFVFHAASISFMLWPAEKSKSTAINRANFLRNDSLGINDSSLECRKLRNHLVHFAERMDVFLEETTMFADINLGVMSKIKGDIKYIRNFDTSTNMFSVLNSSLDIQEIMNSINKLKQLVDERLTRIIS